MPVDLAPASTAELAAVMRECASSRQRLQFVGGGTKQSLGHAPTAFWSWATSSYL